jgi:hypothetical protein
MTEPILGTGQPTPIRRFRVADWPTGLKVSSILGSLLVPVLTSLAFRAVPAVPGFTRDFGIVVAATLPTALLLCLAFVVTGYAVDRHTLYVRRLLWSTRFPLAGLRRVYPLSGLCKGTLRVFGNGGLFAFTGLYRNRELGLFRLFATDLRHSVVLVLPKRTVVVTPAEPTEFVRYLHRWFPDSNEGPASVE